MYRNHSLKISERFIIYIIDQEMQGTVTYYSSYWFISHMSPNTRKSHTGCLQHCRTWSPLRTCNRCKQQNKEMMTEISIDNLYKPSVMVWHCGTTMPDHDAKGRNRIGVTYKGTNCRKNASRGKGNSRYSMIFNTASDLIYELKSIIKISFVLSDAHIWLQVT